MSELVLFETLGGIAILTLNRPEELNALNYALVDCATAAPISGPIVLTSGGSLT